MWHEVVLKALCEGAWSPEGLSCSRGHGNCGGGSSGLYRQYNRLNLTGYGSISHHESVCRSQRSDTVWGERQRDSIAVCSGQSRSPLFFFFFIHSSCDGAVLGHFMVGDHEITQQSIPSFQLES